MSFTTMNTSAPRIWGFRSSDAEMKLARAAGWSRADLAWERLMESALRDWAAGNRRGAVRGFRVAHMLGRICFPRRDLRRAACHANLCIATGATRHQRAALAIWRDSGPQIAAMRIAPRARSSLFHLRMETLHRNTYHDNLRLRIGRIAAETEQTLRRLTAPAGAGHRHFARWRGEKPNVHDDTRKVLSACLLLIDRS